MPKRLDDLALELHALGKGLQSVYLAALPIELGLLLRQLIVARGKPIPLRDERAALIASAEEPERENWERHQHQVRAEEISRRAEPPQAACGLR